MTEEKILIDIIDRLKSSTDGIYWEDLIINDSYKKVLDAFYNYHWTMLEGQENIILLDGIIRDPVEIPYIEVDEIIEF